MSGEMRFTIKHNVIQTILNLLTIGAMLFAMWSKVEHRIKDAVRSEVIIYTESEEFKERFDSTLINSLEHSDVEDKFYILIDKKIYAENLKTDIAFMKKIWRDYLEKEIDKQLMKYKKDPEDLKIEDLEFLVANSSFITSRSTKVKIETLESYLGSKYE